MIWRPPAVADFARRAGFTRGPLVTAVAVALAASGGDDAWWWHPLGTGHIDERGLWALDLGALPELQGRDLWHPLRCAEACREVYLARGRRWDWHRVAAGGLHERHRQTAEAAARAPSPRQLEDPGSPDLAELSSSRALRRMAERVSSDVELAARGLRGLAR